MYFLAIPGLGVNKFVQSLRDLAVGIVTVVSFFGFLFVFKRCLRL